MLTIVYGIGAIFLIISPPHEVWNPVAIETLLLYALIMVALEYLVWRHANSRIAGLVLLGIGYLCISDIWFHFMRNYAGLMAFIGITIIMGIIAIVVLVCGLWGVIHVLLITIGRIMDARKTNEEWAKSNKFVLLIQNWFHDVRHVFHNRLLWHAISILSIFILGILVYGMQSADWQIYGTETIHPGNYQAKFAFWGLMDPSAYTDAEKEQLNQFSALIICFDTPDFQTNFAQDNATFVNECRTWQQTYPQVQIMANVHGIPGGFLWDGSYAGSIALAWTILNITIAQNLTNVIGLNTDQETPQGLPVADTYKNVTRNDLATAAWNEFFSEVNQVYPNRFQFQTTFGLSSAIDVFDGDNDLDVYERNNVMRVPGWDEFAPMIYTAGGPNYIPGVVPADQDFYTLYEQLDVLQASLAQVGLEKGIGVYLGITDMGIFGNTTHYSLLGKEIGTGYDAFGPTSISRQSL